MGGYDSSMPARPTESEYVPYFAAYVAQAEDDVLGQLECQNEWFTRALAMDEERASLRPAPGEWSLKEVLVHLSDFERVFTYRALRFSRGDRTPLEAFEQDPYVDASGANERSLAAIVDEVRALRTATIVMFRAMPDAMLTCAGTAGGSPVTVRALLFIIAGHCAGHMADQQALYAHDGLG